MPLQRQRSPTPPHAGMNQMKITNMQLARSPDPTYGFCRKIKERSLIDVLFLTRITTHANKYVWRHYNVIVHQHHRTLKRMQHHQP